MEEEKEPLFQIVRRKEKAYVRAMPYTVEKPTEAQKDVRDLVATAVKLASQLTAEEVAELIGGEVAGSNLVYYEGQLLPTQAALTKWMVSGMKSPKTKGKIPKWMSIALDLLEKSFKF